MKRYYTDFAGKKESISVAESQSFSGSEMNASDTITGEILVVDDNPVFLHWISNFLAKHGYRVSTVDSALNALELLKSAPPPEIIFLDLVMPGIDGSKLCQKIRKIPRLKKVPIILVTALTRENEITHAEWGFEACIAKGPFNLMAERILAVMKDLKGPADSAAASVGSDNGETPGSIVPSEITNQLFSAKKRLEIILANVREGIVETTDDSRILFVNPAAASILEKPELDILASDFLDFFRKPDRNRIRELNGSGGEFVLRSGKTASLRALSAEDGKRTILMNDLTAIRQSEENLRQHTGFEQLIMEISTRFINLDADRIDEGIQGALTRIGQFSGVDRSYVFLFSNSGKRMNNTHEWCAPGIPPQKDRLQDIEAESAFPWFMDKIRRLDLVYIADTSDLPEEARAEREEFQKEGIKSLLIVPMISQGELIGFVGFDSVREQWKWTEETIPMLKIVGEIFANSLSRSRTEKALRESERKFRELADLLPQIVFELDKKGNFTFVNRYALEHFGYDEFDSGITAISRMAMEDRNGAFEWSLKILSGKKVPGTEFKMLTKAGAVIPVILYAAPVLREDRVVGLRGVAIDITERKRLEDLYRTLAEKSFAGVYVLVDGRFIYINSMFATFTGYAQEELLGKKSEILVHPDDRKTVRKHATDMLKGNRTSPYEFRIVRNDGTIRWAAEAVSSIYYEGRRAVLGHFMDLTDRKVAEEKLKFLSTHDPMTGLYNRLYFEEELERYERGRRFPVNIMMVDVDYLKRTNDRLGHWAGDNLLQRTAQILKLAFRKEDVVARIGGDEFAAIWADSGESTLAAVLKRIEHLVEEHNRDYAEFPLEISIGAAQAQKGMVLRDVMKDADKRMYDYKVAKKRELKPAKILP